MTKNNREYNNMLVSPKTDFSHLGITVEEKFGEVQITLPTLPSIMNGHLIQEGFENKLKTTFQNANAVLGVTSHIKYDQAVFTGTAVRLSGKGYENESILTLPKPQAPPQESEAHCALAG